MHLKPLVDAGVKGFKCFLIESGVEVCVFPPYISSYERRALTRALSLPFFNMR